MGCVHKKILGRHDEVGNVKNPPLSLLTIPLPFLDDFPFAPVHDGANAQPEAEERQQGDAALPGRESSAAPPPQAGMSRPHGGAVCRRRRRRQREKVRFVAVPCHDAFIIIT